MDTLTPPEPTTPEPVPARDGREVSSRRRMLATGIAVAGLTATGGLAVILSVAATSGPSPAADTNISEQQLPVPPQASVAPDASAAPAQPNTQGGTQVQPPANGAGPGQLGGQPPQLGGGAGPGHAASGGS